jgi:hypothetical protein
MQSVTYIFLHERNNQHGLDGMSYSGLKEDMHYVFHRCSLLAMTLTIFDLKPESFLQAIFVQKRHNLVKCFPFLHQNQAS